MSVDPKGTAPGLAPGAQAAPKILNMRCPNTTINCDSIEATEIKIESGDGHRLYRCVKCGYTRSLNVGGYVNL